MEQMFPTSDISYMGSILHEVRNQELTQEIRLSDGMPDIGRVLASWGMPVIRGKEWRSDAVAVSGGVMLWVLYAPEDGTDPRCVENWIPFQMEWDIRSPDREGQIRVQPLLRFVDARAVSARKLMVRAGAAVMAEAAVPMNAKVSIPEETEPDIQLLKTTYPVRLLRHVGEKAFLLDEDLTLPDSCPAPEKLICYSVQPEITEQRVSGDRVVFKGNANLHILCRGRDGQLYTWDFEMPFSQLGNLEEVCDSDAEAGVIPCVTSLELNLEDNGNLRVKCGLVGQYGVTQRKLLELVQDAYGIGREVVPRVEQLELPAVLESRRETVAAEQAVPQEGSSIVDVTFLPDFPRRHNLPGGIELELPGQFQVLYYGEDGMLQSATARWTGTCRLPAGEDIRLNARVIPQSGAGGFFSGGQMQLKSGVALDIESLSEQGIPMVTALEAGQPRESDAGRPSLVLRRANDSSLWQIAKQTGSTVEAIRQANSLQGEPGEDQMLLIPVS